jgi:hypothetical protein
MGDRGQLIAGGAGEFGVQSQYLDRECDLVYDALAGRLHLAPKFEVAQFVVEAIAVFVMDVFACVKFAAKFFGHDQAMFKSFAAASQVDAPVSRRVHETFRVDRAPRTAFPSAFFAAEFLAFVVARMLAVFCAHQATFFNFAARWQLALKSRGGFIVHAGQLLRPFDLVKENF